MKVKLFILLLFLNCSGATAQTFKWHANLEKVDASGFYKIAISPQLISKTENTQLSDIRIFEKNKEVAYLIRETPDSLYIKDTTALKLQHYTLIPSPLVTVKEDKANQRSIVHFTFNAGYKIDKLVLDLEGFRYYRRSAWLTDTNPLIRDKKKRYSENRIESFTISSKNRPTIELSTENRYKQLFLIIENEDSTPLSVKSISAYQKNMELIAFLEKGKQYLIKTGQSNMQLPRYDLSYFKDSIGNAVPYIHAINFKTDQNTDPVEASTWIKRSWMWAAIALLILFLGYLSYFMVKDMQRKKQSH